MCAAPATVTEPDRFLMLGPGVFDRLRSLFRRPGSGGDGRSFIVKDATRVAPKKLIHRDANPVSIIYL
jgi:hypothetical protein